MVLAHASRSIRCALLLALLSTSASAVAANYDPRIAYTSYEGNADNIYLANADGSLRVSVYKATKASITGLDFAPGRVAFTQAGVLKAFTYAVTTNGIVATAPITLDATGAPYQGASQPDFSPDGNYLLYMRAVSDGVTGSVLNEIRVIAATGGAPKVLWTATQSGSRYLSWPRWLSSSEFAFIRGGNLAYSSELQLGSLDANFDLTAPPLSLFTSDNPSFNSFGVYGFDDMDVSRTGASVILSCLEGSTYRRSFIQYDLVAGTFTRQFSDYGYRAHFQAGNAAIVYVHGTSRQISPSDGVYRFDPATNKSTAITPKSSLTGFVDTRP